LRDWIRACRRRRSARCILGNLPQGLAETAAPSKQRKYFVVAELTALLIQGSCDTSYVLLSTPLSHSSFHRRLVSLFPLPKARNWDQADGPRRFPGRR